MDIIKAQGGRLAGVIVTLDRASGGEDECY